MIGTWTPCLIISRSGNLLISQRPPAIHDELPGQSLVPFHMTPLLPISLDEKALDEIQISIVERGRMGSSAELPSVRRHLLLPPHGGAGRRAGQLKKTGLGRTA